jgi:hypothetical protein
LTTSDPPSPKTQLEVRFETPAEALFLGKKLLVIPMTGQYEQECNAAALAALMLTTAPVAPAQAPAGPPPLL